MKREFVFLLTSLMLIGLLGTASMSLGDDDTWTQKDHMPTARYIAGSAVVDGKIYVIGGAPVQFGTTAAVEEYDPVTDTWTRRADMPTARQGVRATAVDGIIYAIGGWGVGRIRSTVEAYDLATDTWDTKADMPTARSLSAIAVVDGIIYVIGGYGSKAGGILIFSAVEAYDPATDTWTTKADMPTARQNLAACVVDGRIHVSGGVPKWGVPEALPTVEVYDPATDTWTQVSDMPWGRADHSASVVAGKMYLIGGADPNRPPEFSTLDVYDPATDTWTTAADFPSPRWQHAAGVVDGKIYTIGGRVGPPGGGAILSTVYEYDTGLPDTIFSVSPAEKLLKTWGQIKKVQ